MEVRLMAKRLLLHLSYYQDVQLVGGFHHHKGIIGLVGDHHHVSDVDHQCVEVLIDARDPVHAAQLDVAVGAQILEAVPVKKIFIELINVHVNQ
jgi:hypothetical protein